MFRMFGKKEEEDPNAANYQASDYAVAMGEDIEPALKKFDPFIKDVMAQLQDDFAASTDAHFQTDELFVLRYILSEKGNTKKVLANIREGLKWRTENKELLDTLKLRDDRSQFIAGDPDSELGKQFAYIYENLAQGLLEDLGELKFPITCARPNFSNQKNLTKNIDKEVTKLYLTLQNEGVFRMVDERTRASGKWVQNMHITDIRGFKPFGKDSDLGLFRLVGSAGKNSEFLHPHMTGKRALVNAPSGLMGFMGIAKRIFSKKSMDKMGICTAGNVSQRNDAAEKCPFVEKYQMGDIVPPFLGGKAQCPVVFARDLKNADGK